MQQRTTNKTDENRETAKSAADKVEELPQQPVSESDAETVKGGSNRYNVPTPPQI